MLRSYDKFSEADRRLIREWQIGVTAFYGAALLVLLAIVIVNHSIDGWVTNAAQAGIRIPVTGTITTAKQIALPAKGSLIGEVKKTF